MFINEDEGEQQKQLGIDGGQGKSYWNRGEAEVLLKLVLSLLKAKSVNPGDIGVITPYTAQVNSYFSACVSICGQQLITIILLFNTTSVNRI